MDNLRTAYALADRVEDVEKQLKEVKFEWGEVEEKLLAREERLRKRLSRELKRELDTQVMVENPVGPQIVAPEGAQAAKKAISMQFRKAREG